MVRLVSWPTPQGLLKTRDLILVFRRFLILIFRRFQLVLENWSGLFKEWKFLFGFFPFEMALSPVAAEPGCCCPGPWNVLGTSQVKQNGHLGFLWSCQKPGVTLHGCEKRPLGWDLSNDAGTTVERFLQEKSHLDQDDPTRKSGNTDRIFLLFKRKYAWALSVASDRWVQGSKEVQGLWEWLHL